MRSIFEVAYPDLKKQKKSGKINYVVIYLYLQDTNTKMWREWLPNCKEYKLGGNYNIEMYGPPCEEDMGESYVELWLPIERL